MMRRRKRNFQHPVLIWPAAPPLPSPHNGGGTDPTQQGLQHLIFESQSPINESKWNSSKYNLKYRVTIQVVPNLLLTSKQKLCFSKRSMCTETHNIHFDANRRLGTIWMGHPVLLTDMNVNRKKPYCIARARVFAFLRIWPHVTLQR